MAERPTCPRCGKPMIRGPRAQSGKLRWRCITESGGERTLCYQTTDPSKPVRDKQNIERMPEFKAPIRKQTIVLTWAQNATPVFKGFWNSLLALVKDRDAQLMVEPGRYRNPTSIWTDKDESQLWWADEVKPYLCNQRSKLHKRLVFLADVNVQPTASRPLSGFESLTHAESGIIGHPKLQMQCIPTPHQRLPKIMTTTGAVTKSNYTDSKAGKKGDFHHVFGAVIIELDGDRFHLRHINARNDGAFVDLNRAYFPDGSVKDAGPYEAIVFGDAHARFADPGVVSATFGAKGLVEKLNPKTLVFHDLFDGYSVNPHHLGNPFIDYAKSATGFDDVSSEVDYTIECVKSWSKNRKVVIVPSNHDDMLSRWVKRVDWKEQTARNKRFYLETALHMLKQTKMTAEGSRTPDPFAYHVDKAQLKNVYCLPPNTSFMIAGIELGLHGHEGPNGARGNIRNLSKIGVKTMTGHPHSPGILEGCYQVGTMTPLSLEYTGPVGSWLNAHGSIDPMGKRHIHICIDGRFWK
jgi:hypothetical protein